MTTALEKLAAALSPTATEAEKANLREKQTVLTEDLELKSFTLVTPAHTVVGHTSPDIECSMGLFALRHIPIFKEHFGVQDGAKLKFIPAGPLRKEDWEALGFTKRVTGPELEALGYRFFDCGGGELDQHGRLEVLQQQYSSLDLMVLAAKADFVPDQTVYVRNPETGEATDIVDYVVNGHPGNPDYMSTLKFLFELVSKNDLTAEDIVQDHEYRTSEWPHTQRTLRNFVTALNLLHPKRPDVVVKVMDIAFMGLITYAEEQARIAADDSDAVLADLPEDVRTKIARSAFLVPNIIEGLKVLDEETHTRFVREVKQAFDLYEAEWLVGVRDYNDSEKTRVYSGIQLRCIDEETGNVFFRKSTAVVTISESERIGAVCRLGNWSKDDGVSRKDHGHEARRGADVVLHFQEGNNRKFTISTRHILLNDVAAVIRTADLLAEGVRLTADQIRSFAEPGHIAVPHGNEDIQVLYLAEFGKAFGHLRSNPFSRPTALSRKMITELLLRALNEGLSKRLVNDILDGRVLRG